MVARPRRDRQCARQGQLLTGSLTSADQFKVVDAHTFEVTLPKPDKLALANLAVVYPVIFNSKLAKSKATAEDPGRWPG